MGYRELGEGMSLLEITGWYRFAGPGIEALVPSLRFHGLQVFGWPYLWQLRALCLLFPPCHSGWRKAYSDVFSSPSLTCARVLGMPFSARNNNYHGMSLGVVDPIPGAPSYHHLYHSYIFCRKFVTLALQLLRFPG